MPDTQPPLPKSFRRICYLVLAPAEPNNEAEHRRIIWLSRVVDSFLIALIVTNVAAVILETVPDIARDWGFLFHRFEIISVVIFTIEYVFRIWSIVEREQDEDETPLGIRSRYMATPLALTDLLAILPFYLSAWIGLDLRMLRVLRLLRVLKLSRYSTSMSLLLDVLRAEARAITSAIFILSLILLIAASFAFLAEHEAQPEAFGSIPDALWWTVVTMTTVGFGDVVPITPFGKVLGGIVGVIGIGMVALPTGLLAAGFSEAIHERERLFEAEVESRLADQQFDKADRIHLEAVRRRLGLRSSEAQAIMHMVVREARKAPPVCPHCEKPLIETPRKPTPRKKRRHVGKGLLGS